MEDYKSKVTQGEVKQLGEVSNNTRILDNKYWCNVVSGGRGIVCDSYGRTQQEAEANSQLISEAFNTLSDSGFTPAEIWKQNQELLEALKELYAFSLVSLQHIKTWRTKANHNPELEEAIEKYSAKALTAIQNCKTK